VRRRGGRRVLSAILRSRKPGVLMENGSTKIRGGVVQ
jgi:hypothetical protein